MRKRRRSKPVQAQQPEHFRAAAMLPRSLRTRSPRRKDHSHRLTPPAPSSSHEHPHPLHRQQLPQPNGSRHPAIPRLASARVLCRHETRRARASRGSGRPEGACVNMEKWTRETVEAIKPESADLVFSVCEAKAEDVQKIQPSSQGRGAARATRRPGAALLQTPWSSGRACAAVRRRTKTSCAGLIETFRAEKASGSLRRLSRPPHPPFHHPAHPLIVMSRRGLRTVGTRRFAFLVKWKKLGCRLG